MRRDPRMPPFSKALLFDAKKMDKRPKHINFCNDYFSPHIWFDGSLSILRHAPTCFPSYSQFPTPLSLNTGGYAHIFGKK